MFLKLFHKYKKGNNLKECDAVLYVHYLNDQNSKPISVKFSVKVRCSHSSLLFCYFVSIFCDIYFKIDILFSKHSLFCFILVLLLCSDNNYIDHQGRFKLSKNNIPKTSLLKIFRTIFSETNEEDNFDKLIHTSSTF